MKEKIWISNDYQVRKLNNYFLKCAFNSLLGEVVTNSCLNFYQTYIKQPSAVKRDGHTVSMHTREGSLKFIQRI